MASCKLRSSWMPIAFSGFVSLGIIVAFSLHYSREEEVNNFPQISQAAGDQPQSGIFCIFLFLAAFVGFFSMLLRYVSVQDMNHPTNRIVKIINALSIVPGVVSLIGMVLVAAYPLSPEPYHASSDWIRVAIRPHHVGSRILFLCVNIYYVLQTILTITLWRKEGIVLCCSRALLVVVTIAAYAVMRGTPSPQCVNCPARNGTIIHRNMCWGPVLLPPVDNSTSGGGDYIIMTRAEMAQAEMEFCKANDRYVDTVSISELFLAVFLVVYFLTFIKEYRHISVTTIVKFQVEQVNGNHLTPLPAMTQL